MSFTDNFVRPDEYLEDSVNWSLLSGTGLQAAVRSNLLAIIGGSDSAVVCPDQGAVNHVTRSIRRSVAAYGFFECAVRITDHNNFVGARYSGSAWEVYENVATSYNRLGFSGDTPSADDIMDLYAIGPSILLTINTDEIILGPFTITDNLTATRQGIITHTSTANPILSGFYAAEVSGAQSNIFTGPFGGPFNGPF